MILVAIDSEINQPSVQYVINTLLEDFLGLKYDLISINDYQKDSKHLIKIYYGFDKKNENDFDLIIYSNKIWIDNYLEKDSLPPSPLQKYRNKDLLDIIDFDELPIIYSGEQKEPQKPFIDYSQEKIITNVDFFASAFFMLTRYEEIVNQITDEDANFPCKKSLAYIENYLERPIVNEYVELLWFLLKKLQPVLKRKEMNFQLFLTHDIDDLKLGTFKKRVRSIISQIVRKKSLRGFLSELWRNFAWIFTLRKNTFNYILFTSEKYGFQSTFYFLLNGTSKLDNRYDPYSPKVRGIIKKIIEKGHKVGLHSSYSSYLDFDQLLKEKNILKDIIDSENFGVRNHYLRIKVPESLRNYEKANLVHDSSLGYSKCYGYRAGTCYPYYFFDILENRKLNIKEYPLIIMDMTIIDNYPELDKPQKVLDAIKKQIDVISFYKGTFVFLVHNHSFEQFQYPWRSIYKKILGYCKIKEEQN